MTKERNWGGSEIASVCKHKAHINFKRLNNCIIKHLVVSCSLKQQIIYIRLFWFDFFFRVGGCLVVFLGFFWCWFGLFFLLQYICRWDWQIIAYKSTNVHFPMGLIQQRYQLGVPSVFLITQTLLSPPPKYRKLTRRNKTNNSVLIKHTSVLLPHLMGISFKSFYTWNFFF